jgi:D-serine deaminase-like pyridoxal phosphate-dependent protein
MIGQNIRDIETPVLWVDLEIMEKNIEHFSSFFKTAGVSWRPHIKGIKVPAVVHKLIQAGASGIACSKLSEAEVMASAGIKDILIANQVVGQTKLERLAAIQRHSKVIVAVDSIENSLEISKEASNKGITIQIVIEVNTGMNRCGVEPGKPVLELARQIANFPGIELVGLMTWEGGSVAKINNIDEKREKCHLALKPFVKSADLCREAGIELSILSCGGSGTYMVSSYVPGVTEIQAGGAVFGSVTYREWGVKTECALFVMATVISRPTHTRAIIDAGRKAMNIELAYPEPYKINGVKIAALHSEHGILDLDNPEISLNIGDKIDFLVGWGDYTVNLYDQIYAVRNGVVEAVWDIEARGKMT